MANEPNPLSLLREGKLAVIVGEFAFNYPWAQLTLSQKNVSRDKAKQLQALFPSEEEIKQKARKELIEEIAEHSHSSRDTHHQEIDKDFWQALKEG